LLVKQLINLEAKKKGTVTGFKNTVVAKTPCKHKPEPTKSHPKTTITRHPSRGVLYGGSRRETAMIKIFFEP